MLSRVKGFRVLRSMFRLRLENLSLRVRSVGLLVKDLASRMPSKVESLGSEASGAASGSRI